MNKKMRELLAKIEQKVTEANKCMEGETKDVSKAQALLNEVAALKDEYEVEKQLFDLSKDKNVPKETLDQAKAAKTFEESLKAFGRAAKTGFATKTNDYDDTMNETVDAEGGYIVPDDIQTRVESLREASFSLLSLVRRIPVKTKSGARTFKKRSQHTGFNKVGEGGKIGLKATPQFERLTYNIEKYAGYLPITNELRYDTDANIGRIIMEWMADESRATANNLILAAINSNGEEKNFEDLDGIKTCINTDLGSAFRDTTSVITNDDGLNYLDQLKKSSTSNEYLLTPDPANPMKRRISVGGTTVPLEVLPNGVMPSVPTYSASEDTSVTAGKTYYTRSGSGTAESPYVYTKVTTPAGNPSTSSYYEMDPTKKIPFVVGDLFEGIAYFDRQKMTIAESAIAAIGDFNAFEEDLTLYRAIEREDVKTRDSEAFYHGYIQPAVPSGE